jgi:hypothetical protein
VGNFSEQVWGVSAERHHQVAGRPEAAAAIYREHLTGDSFSHRDYGYFASVGTSATALANEPAEAARLAMTAPDCDGYPFRAHGERGRPRGAPT